MHRVNFGGTEYSQVNDLKVFGMTPPFSAGNCSSGLPYFGKNTTPCIIA
jgi:hypothetical protein